MKNSKKGNKEEREDGWLDEKERKKERKNE
jgi:hypothetical protein